MSARRAAVAVSIALAGAALGLPSSVALGHEGNTHRAEDSAPHAVADEARLGSLTSQATARDAATAAAAVTGDEQDVGQWGPVVDWPVVGVHVALLPERQGARLRLRRRQRDRDLSRSHDHTRATVWDPATGTQTPVNVDTGFNVFCSGLAHLHGRLDVPRGRQQGRAAQRDRPDPHLQPDDEHLEPRPEHGRRALVSERHAAAQRRDADHRGRPRHARGPHDRRRPARAQRPRRSTCRCTRGSTSRPTAAPSTPGPDQTMRSLNTSGGGAWQTFGQRDTHQPQLRQPRALRHRQDPRRRRRRRRPTDARVIDINGATPQVSATAPMANGRRQHNLTVLADGTRARDRRATRPAPALVDLNNGVYAAELWNPATGQWTTLAAKQVTRQYHSTALLLPDGRVLSAGGGICGTCDAVGYLAKNAEVFTPPYLFKKDGSGELAPRPTITGAPPSAAATARRSRSRTPNAATIRKVGAGAPRRGHALGEHGAALRAALLHRGQRRRSPRPRPRNANIAPPGMYMLVRGRRQRRAVGGAHGDAEGNASPTVSLTPAGERRDVHRTGDGRASPRPPPTRTAPSPRSSSSTARRSSARTRPAPYTYDVDRRGGRLLHADRPRDRQPRRDDDERREDDHRRLGEQPPHREHHLTGQRRDVPPALDHHHHRDGERHRRHGPEGRVLPRARRSWARTRPRRTRTAGGTSPRAATS